MTLRKLAIGYALVCILVLMFVPISCGDSRFEPLVKGTHQVKSILVVDKDLRERNWFEISLFKATDPPEHTSELVVLVMWQQTDGIYVNTSIPYENLKTTFQKNAFTPTIEFNWEKDCYFRKFNHKSMQFYIDECVIDATITLTEEDWKEMMIRDKVNDEDNK